MAKKQKFLWYSNDVGKFIDESHLLPRKGIEDRCGDQLSNILRKSSMQLEFENPDQIGNLTKLACEEAQRLSKTYEGQTKLLAILLYIRERKQIIFDTEKQLYRRLMLPKEWVLSYYLDVAELIKKDHPEAARVIEELYEAKLDLEKMVTRISLARDLLLLEQTNQAASSEKSLRVEKLKAQKIPRVEHGLMAEDRIRQPGWYEMDVLGDGDWQHTTFQQARVLQAKGSAVRFRNKTRVIAVWPFNLKLSNNYYGQPLQQVDGGHIYPS